MPSTTQQFNIYTDPRACRIAAMLAKDVRFSFDERGRPDEFDVERDWPWRLLGKSEHARQIQHMAAEYAEEDLRRERDDY